MHHLRLVLLGGVPAPSHGGDKCGGLASEGPGDGIWGLWMSGMKMILFAAAAMALSLGHLSGCASIAAYQASHPYYRFPGGGGGSGANS